MTRWFLFTLIAISIVNCSAPEENLQLKDKIVQVLDTVEGDFALAYFNFNTQEELLINESEPFHAASTMKTPVLIEAYKKARSGFFGINDSILLNNEFYSIVDSSQYFLTRESDGDPELYDRIGTRIGWRELMEKMITRSSNLATNVLIRELNAIDVTQTMRELGAPSIQVLRGVEDIKAYEAGLSNSTTAYDLLQIFKKIGLGEAVDSAASEEMIQIMSRQEFSDIIPAELPQDVKIAHKTGSITGVRHDSGIIFLPDGRKYVLVLLSKNLNNEDEGVRALAKVSKIIYDEVAQNSLPLESITNG
ncbi:serine hydrolase [Membranihabitans maritimus]|uniref:serine hydrolase n=1 Tax=Membranihabitans maritimus TaxID=2904244 RepID=UPI001F440104|nr:serine hydrolase [Membranihabitans maritimus]